MAAATVRIALRLLRSPKRRIEFRPSLSGIPGQSFLDLKQRYKDKLPVEPITVTRHGDEYLILDGVRRSLAALAAGLTDIDAVLVSKSAAGPSFGASVPLIEVRFPFDARDDPANRE